MEYVYRCKECGSIQNKEHSFALCEELHPCPNCGFAMNRVPQAVRLHGSSWDILSDMATKRLGEIKREKARA